MATSAQGAVISGVLVTALAAILLCRIPDSTSALSYHPFLLALAYLGGSLTVGAVYFLCWRAITRSSPLTSPELIKSLSCCLWLPAVVLFAKNNSLGLFPSMAMLAVVLASSLHAIRPENIPAKRRNSGDRYLFSQSLEHSPRDWKPFVLALCLYASVLAVKRREMLVGSVLFAAFAFVAAWQLSPVQEDESTKPDLKQIFRYVLLAFLATFLSLLHWRQPMQTMGEEDQSSSPGKVMSRNGSLAQGQREARQSLLQPFGYQSIILRPQPEKKDLSLRLPVTPRAGWHLGHTPRIIPFTGAYWYFQPPNKTPGREARIENTTPLKTNIHATNLLPLIMEAHQELRDPIESSCCRAIHVQLKSCEASLGQLLMGVFLSSSSRPEMLPKARPKVSLGFQPISAAPQTDGKEGCLPKTQTVSFSIPENPLLRHFNEITLLFLRDPSRADLGAKVEVQQFDFDPR